MEVIPLSEAPAPPMTLTQTKNAPTSSLREQLVDLQLAQDALHEKYMRDWNALERQIEKIEEEIRTTEKVVAK